MCGGGWEVVVRDGGQRVAARAQPATLLRESLFGHPSQSPGVHVGPRAGSLRKSVSGSELPLSGGAREPAALGISAEGMSGLPQRLQGVRCGFVVCGGGKCVGERFVVCE